MGRLLKPSNIAPNIGKTLLKYGSKETLVVGLIVKIRHMKMDTVTGVDLIVKKSCLSERIGYEVKT